MNELVDIVRRVAEAAGYEKYEQEVRSFHGGPNSPWKETWYRKIGEERGPGRFPGTSGSLEGECETVLMWLAKAGYDFYGYLSPDGAKYEVMLTNGVAPNHTEKSRSTEKSVWTMRRGDTLHEALAAALLALPREDSNQGRRSATVVKER